MKRNQSFKKWSALVVQWHSWAYKLGPGARGMTYEILSIVKKLGNHGPRSFLLKMF